MTKPQKQTCSQKQRRQNPGDAYGREAWKSPNPDSWQHDNGASYNHSIPGKAGMYQTLRRIRSSRVRWALLHQASASGISNLEERKGMLVKTNREDKHMEPRHRNPDGRSISMDCQTMIKHMHDAPKNSASAITITCRFTLFPMNRRIPSFILL